MRDDEATIRFFFYGTLMRGECCHDLVAPWLVAAEPARVWGRLFHLEAGYPALEVPAESIVCHGTSDPLRDAESMKQQESCPVKMHAGDWGWVHGEVALLRDPEQSVPPLDDYEDFKSGEPCLYQRVLIPSATEKDILPVWTYVRTTGDGGQRLHGGVWIP